jgi:hypothetical protein
MNLRDPHRITPGAAAEFSSPNETDRLVIFLALFSKLKYRYYEYLIDSIGSLKTFNPIITLLLMRTYQHPLRKFTLVLPDGWREPWLITRVLTGSYRKQQEHPEFLGPFNSSLKVASSAIYKIPGVLEQQNSLERLAEKYGNKVIEVGMIHVQGKDHATIIFSRPGVGETKIYSLIFGHTEYLITARGRYREIDTIVESFRA